MEKQRFVDRILETENLTDELEDSDASWLLDWGIKKLDEVLGTIDDEDIAGTRVNALMAVIRKINRISSFYTVKSPQELREDLVELSQLYSNMRPDAEISSGASLVGLDERTTQLAQMSVRELLETLTQ